MFDQDFMIVTKGVSVAGGIYQKQEDVVEEVPKGFIKDDIETIMNSFFLISLKKYALLIGISK